MQWFHNKTSVFATVFVAAMILLLFLAPSKAQGVQRLMVCDEAAQTTSVFRQMLEEKVALPAAIETVNEKAASAACGLIAGVFHPLEVVESVVLDGKTFDTVRVKVIAIATPQGLIPTDVVQFVAAPKSGFDA